MEPTHRVLRHQLCMTGADWLSARDRRAQARSATKRAQLARTFAARMEATLQAAEAYRSACRACGEDVARADDTRNVLVEGLKEYSHFLRCKYGQ